MAVSDLTNTTWVINDSPTFTNIQGNTFDINFTSNNRIFIALEFPIPLGGSDDINYHYPDSVEEPGFYDRLYNSSNGGWLLQAYRIIEITGGNDATDATLIAWLEANATQVPVDDLSGTTWIINDEPNLSNIEGGQVSYNINFVSNSTNYNVIVLQGNTAIKYSSNGSVVVAYQLSTPPIEEGGIN